MALRPYTGNKDGISKTNKARPGLVKFMEIAQNRWGLSNLGSFGVRQMNNPKADPNDPKWLSVHATGRACDLGYSDREKAIGLWDFLIAHTAELGIEEIHDYSYDKDPKDKELGWGRGYRCSRGEGEKGVKIYDANDNAGSQGGKWFHVELSPAMADDEKAFVKAWKACNAAK